MSATTKAALFSRQYAASLDEKIQLSGKRSQENMRKIGELKASLSSLFTSQAPSSVEKARQEEVSLPHIVTSTHSSHVGPSSAHVAEYLEKAHEEIKRLTEANHALTLECVRLKESHSFCPIDGSRSDIVHSPKASILSYNNPELVDELESFLSRLVTLYPDLLLQTNDNRNVGTENVCSLLQSLEDPIMNAMSMAKATVDSLETNADLVDLAHQREQESSVDYERLIEIIHTLEQTNVQLKKDAKEKDSVITVLQENERELRESLDVLLGEKEDLSDQLKQLEEEKRIEKQEADETEASPETNHTDPEAAQAPLREELEQLSNQLAEKEAQVKESNEKMDAAFHRNLALVEEKQALQENIEQLTQKVEGLNAQVEAFQVEIDAVQKEKDAAATEFDTHKESAAVAFAEEKKQLAEQIEELKRENSLFADKMKALSDDLESANKLLTASKAELETLKANEKTLRQEKLNIANIVSDQDKKIYELESEKRNLQEQVESANKEREAVKADVHDKSEALHPPQSFINFDEMEHVDSDEEFSYPEPANLSEWLCSWDLKSINYVYPAGEEAQTQLDSAGPLYHVGMCVAKEMGLNTTSKQWQRFLFQVQNTLDQEEETSLSVVASDTMQLFFHLLKSTGMLDKLSMAMRCALATFSLLFFVTEVTDLSNVEAAAYDILKHIEATGEEEKENPNTTFYTLIESADEEDLKTARALLQSCLQTVAQEDRLTLTTRLLFDCHFATSRGAVAENVDRFACIFLFFARAIVAARNVTDIRSSSMRPQAEAETVALRFYTLAVPLGVAIIRSFPDVQKDILAIIKSTRENLEVFPSSYSTLPELMSFIQAAIQKLPVVNSVIMSAEAFEATQRELLQVYAANEVCSNQLETLLKAIESKQLTG